MGLFDIFGNRKLNRSVTVRDLQETENRIMAKLSELGGKLAAIETTLNKVKDEVENLRDQLGDVELPAEAEAALGRLEALSKTIDDINPDAPPPTP